MSLVLLLLPLATALQTGRAETSCSIGYADLLSNGKCLKYLDSYEIIDNGFVDCEKEGAHPPTIHSYEENNNFIKAVRTYGNSHSALLGLRCNNGRAEWRDGSPMDFDEFNTKDDRSCDNGKYPHVGVDLGSATWQKISWFNPELVDVFCEKPALKEPPTLPPVPTGNCNSGYHPYFNGKCLKYLDAYEIIDHGFDDCDKDHAHPPTIHSAEENNNFIKAVRTYGNSHSALLGLTCIGGYARWSDGSSMDFDEFHTNDDERCENGNHPHVGVDLKSGTWQKISFINPELVDVFCEQPSQPDTPPTWHQPEWPTDSPAMTRTKPNVPAVTSVPTTTSSSTQPPPPTTQQQPVTTHDDPDTTTMSTRDSFKLFSAVAMAALMALVLH